MDIERPAELLAYLRASGRIAPDEEPRMRVLAGGVSNRTVRLERPTGEAWVLKQALAKLRVEVDWFSDPARIHREAAAMRYLAEIAPPGSVPRLLFEDAQEHLLAMEAVPEPHRNWKAMLLRGQLEPDHVTQFAALLASIHAAVATSDRAEELREVFADRSYFESLRLEPYYLYAAEQVPEASSYLRELAAATKQRQLTLVHGDYSPKNVLVYRGWLVLLDHEVMHLGDPAFDLGFALTHLLGKAHHLSVHREAFAAAAVQFWREYAERARGLPFFVGLEPHAVRHTLACLLARVAGRSPLEYLSGAERAAQRAVAVGLMRQEPRSLEQLVASFVEGVEDVGHRSA